MVLTSMFLIDDLNKNDVTNNLQDQLKPTHQTTKKRGFPVKAMAQPNSYPEDEWRS